jgi:hypothetical protein
MNQYFDPKTGNYNVPKGQYEELVLGMANLVAPTGTANESTIKELRSRTAKGDLAGALQYATSTPWTGNSQQIIKNLVESIDRQGKTSNDLRDNYMAQLQPPANLPPDRAQRVIEKGRGEQFENHIPKIAVNKSTGEKAISYDNGKTWKVIK